MASNISTPALTPTPTPSPGAIRSSHKTTTVKIRQATPQDAEQISHLGTVVFTASFGDSGCSPAQLQKYLDDSYSVAAIRADLTDAHKTTLVAVEDASFGGGAASEQVIGFALLNRASSAHEPAIAGGHYSKPVEIQRLYVGLESHGRGVGQALMNEAEGLARREGWEHVWLGVWEYNFRAQKIYAKLGYTRVGEHLFDVGGDPQWDWILVKKL